MPALSRAEYQAATVFMRETLARTENFSASALGDYQRDHLKHFLHFAYAQSPFYKERLAPIFRRDGTIDWPRWQDVPILTRADLKHNGAAMMAKSTPEGHGIVHAAASSGTTATPVTTHCSTMMAIAGTAAFTRACRWYGQRASDRFCIVFGPSKLESLDPRSWTIGHESEDNVDGVRSPNRLAVSRHWPPERILSLMEQHGSTCFSGNSVTLEDVAEAQMQRRARIDMNFLVGTDMAVTERAREFSRQTLKARTFSAYTSTEAHKIAHECPVSGGFHVNSELVLVEILDDAGNPCERGETGRVILTPLLGTAQPLIRYEQGDLASWGGPCACGRSHPLIAKIDGRIRNRFRFANGHRFVPGIGFAPYSDLLKADRWQVAQTGSLDIEVRFMSSAPDDAIDFAGLTLLYRKAFHHDLNVTYRRVGAMPLTAAGKFIDYVNEYTA